MYTVSLCLIGRYITFHLLHDIHAGLQARDKVMAFAILKMEIYNKVHCPLCCFTLILSNQLNKHNMYKIQIKTSQTQNLYINHYHQIGVQVHPG